MKRIILLLTTFMLLSVQGFSQFGIKGGLNFNSIKDINLKGVENYNIQNSTGFNVGILYKAKLPLTGIAIQPELLYSQTNSSIDTNLDGGVSNLHGDLKLSTLMLPVGIQWGVDLMLFRPFIQVVPYIGCVVGTENKITSLDWNVEKFKYGIGLGAGLDIWKLQISGRYRWDLGNVAEFEWKGVDTFKGGKSKGFELSLAFLF